MGMLNNLRAMFRKFWKFTSKKDFHGSFGSFGSLLKLPELRKFRKDFQNFQPFIYAGSQTSRRNFQNFLTRAHASARVITWKLYTPKGVYITSNVISLGSLLNFQIFLAKDYDAEPLPPCGAARCNPSAKKIKEANICR